MSESRFAEIARAFTERSTALLVGIAAIILLGMMAVTTADVLGRFFLARSLAGATEIVSAGLALAVAFALPAATWKEGHLALLLLSVKNRPKLERLRVGLTFLVAAVVVAALAWTLWLTAVKAAEYQDVIGYLEIPMAPVILVLAVMAFVAALILFLNTVGIRRPPDDGSAGPEIH